MKKLLSTENLYLRALELADVSVLYKWENDEEYWCQGNTVQPYSAYSIKNYIEDSLKGDLFSTFQMRLMVCLATTNEAIGCVDLFEFDAHNLTASIGLIIGPDFQNRGYGTHALDLLVKYASSYFHIRTFMVKILSINEKSKTVFIKEGFQQVGMLKKWIDVEGEFVDVLILQKIC